MVIKFYPAVIECYIERVAHTDRNFNEKEHKYMSKGQDSKKTEKKDPAKTPKEKKAEKKIKKDGKKK